MGGTLDLSGDRSLRIRRPSLALVLSKLRSKCRVTDGESETQRVRGTVRVTRRTLSP